MIAASQAGRTGVYNAAGPGKPPTMQQILETCQQVSDSVGEFVWVPDDFLLRHGVRPFTEMPLWLPQADDRVDSRRATRAGLALRPLPETIWATLAWDLARPPGTPLRAGLTSDREIGLLQAWGAEREGEVDAGAGRAGG